MRGVDAGPRRIGESLDAALSRLAPPHAPGAPSAGSLAAVFSRWEEIVGPALAEHIRPVELSAGTLVVAADHPAWATQVRSLSASVLARVGEISGETPGALRVVVRPGPGTPRRRSGGDGVG
jgi:hypothetical protein